MMITRLSNVKKLRAAGDHKNGVGWLDLHFVDHSEHVQLALTAYMDPALAEAIARAINDAAEEHKSRALEKGRVA